MKTSPALSPSAEDQAALWAARLDGSTLDAVDRIALDAWLAENPAHRTLLSGYCQFSADLELQIPALVAAGSVSVPTAKKAARRNLVWFPRLALAAAALVVAGVWFTYSAARFETVASSVAQRQTITLADGTIVELNARTTLQVALNRSERRVRLSDGEAFFTVSKDPARPFTVETPTGSVRVTGTVFNVRTATASSLDVTVVEGSVQVRPDQLGGSASPDPVALRAGDHLTASRAKGVSVHPLSAGARDETLAWRQGQIVFHDTPLPEALARFARYHARTVTATPGVVAADLHVGGRRAIDDLEGFLADIETTQPVRVNRLANGTVRVSLPTEP